MIIIGMKIVTSISLKQNVFYLPVKKLKNNQKYGVYKEKDIRIINFEVLSSTSDLKVKFFMTSLC